MSPALFALACAVAASDGSAEDWRSERPPVPAAEAPVLPSFSRAELGNGLALYVTEVDTVPLVSFRLVTLGGSSADPDGRDGLTSLMYALMEEGAGDLDALAFSDRVADLGARFGAASARDHGVLSIGGLARQAPELMRLLASTAREPRFDPGAFTRVKAETLASIERSLASPQGAAFMLFPGLVYGEGHPLAHPPSGTTNSMGALQLSDVQAQYEATFAPNRSALIVTGALSLEDARRLAEAHFGSWAKGSEAPAALPPAEPRPRQAIHIVDRPGSAQTLVLFGRPLFGRGGPDEIPLSLANEAFGGAFTSRLNSNLREDKGYTYGASSNVTFRRGVGVFLAYSAVQSQVTGPAVQEILRELAGLTNAPLRTAELELARDGIVRSLPGQFQTAGAIGSAAVSLYVYDLPLDYFRDLGERYATASLSRVQRTSQSYLSPDSMQILLVGDMSEVLPQLKALDLGPTVDLTSKLKAQNP